MTEKELYRKELSIKSAKSILEAEDEHILNALKNAAYKSKKIEIELNIDKEIHSS